MKLSPRKEEVAAVVAVITAVDERETVLNPDYGAEILDDNGAPLGTDDRRRIPNPDLGTPLYDDEKAMARAIIAALGTELSKRDWYVMPWSLPGEGGGINYGPFATVGDLEEYAAVLPDGEHRAVLVLGPDRPRGTDDAEVHAGTCRCGHGQHNHVVKNVRGGKTSAPGECGVYSARNKKCPCAIYEQEK